LQETEFCGHSMIVDEGKLRCSQSGEVTNRVRAPATLNQARIFHRNENFEEMIIVAGIGVDLFGATISVLCCPRFYSICQASR